MLPEPKILFQQLQTVAGTAGGARERFQLLVTDLVMVEHPGADEVEAPGGQDWGIDTFVGRLDTTITVWQSKFFMDWSGETQRKQVRDSFSQIVSKAKSNGITLQAWILALPINLPPAERKWFDTWSSKQATVHGLTIELWGGAQLRHKLMRPDAAHVYDAYFVANAGRSLSAESVSVSDNLAEFDDALFVRQLVVAGQVETDAARGMFFAADALVRDIAAREDPRSIAAIAELHLEVHHVWQQQFNAAVEHADAVGRMPGLIDGVLKGAEAIGDPEGLRLRPAHRRGVAHRLVEDAKAGWVTHWRAVAVEHANTHTVSVPVGATPDALDGSAMAVSEP